MIEAVKVEARALDLPDWLARPKIFFERSLQSFDFGHKQPRLFDLSSLREPLGFLSQPQSFQPIFKPWGIAPAEIAKFLYEFHKIFSGHDAMISTSPSVNQIQIGESTGRSFEVSESRQGWLLWLFGARPVPIAVRAAHVRKAPALAASGLPNPDSSLLRAKLRCGQMLLAENAAKPVLNHA
jgi:hypothetical protein